MFDGFDLLVVVAEENFIPRDQWVKADNLCLYMYMAVVSGPVFNKN